MIPVALTLVLAASLGAGAGAADAQVATDDDEVAPLTLIPIPRAVDIGVGHLHLTDRTRIAVTQNGRAEGEHLAEILRPATALPLPVTGEEPKRGDITLRITDDDDPAESYRLRVDGTGATITAPSTAGLFYGGQTLRQLLPAEIERPAGRASPGTVWRLPMVTIWDAPAYEWRGAMLDIARHFFTADEINQYVDHLATYKINRLHLHLSDDQGWRIEIPSRPRLTAVGGRTDIDGGAGGFLTVADYQKVVDHAARRHMTVVPEVDVPGHVNAALASYGELNPSGTPTRLGGATTYGRSTLDPRLPATAPFLTTVFTELAAMTPGPYIHLGGDETFATSAADYTTMVRQAVDAIRASGKIPVGWEEIVNADLDGEYVAQHWLDPLQAVRASRRGAQVIMSPAARAYLDQKYDVTTALGLDWAGPIEVDQAYRWDPTGFGVDKDSIAGVEAPLWTETVSGPDQLEHLAFPRVIGIAEIGWSDPRDRGFAGYLERLAAHGPRLEARGIDFYRSPLVDWAAG